MFKRIYGYITIFAASLFFIVACKEDVEKIEKFTSNVDVTNSLLKDDKYSMTLLFSTDDGKTWADYPILSPGQTYMAKVLNQKTGDVVTTDDDFEFDWSKSDPAPIGDAASEVAKFTSNKVNSIKVSVVSHLCPYVASSWTGDWGGDEVGSCCGGTDNNTIRQDGTNPNKFIMDNFWGDGVDAYFILTPSSTSVFDQVLTMPQQVTSEGGTASGTGTYDQCAETFTIATKYSFPGLTDLQVQALTVSSSSDARLYAATSSGLFTSSNSGGTWTLQNAGLTGVLRMVATGTKVFAAKANGISYSPDRGLTWSQANSGLTDTNVTALIISGANIFAGTKNGGVFLSTNSGTSWSAVNNGLTNTSVTALAVSGSDLYVGTEGGAFHSTDNGANWVRIAANITNTFISLAATGTNLYAGTSSGLLYSADKGTTWTSVVSDGLTNANVTLLTAAGTDVYARTAGGVFYSANNGTKWALVSKGLASSSVVSLIAAPTVPTKTYIGTSDAGAFNTTNGTSWTNLNNGTEYVFQYNFHRL
jgi:photosystem II stability/assembly factor-like uncharacterized protein